MEIIRDRDYILDTEGNILRVVGDHQLEGAIMSFVKYHPSERGSRVFQGKRYIYNTFPNRSYNLLKESKGRFAYSSRTGTVVTVTANDQIQKHFSCREKVRTVVANPDPYLKHPVGKYVVQFIEAYPEIGQLNEIGITGSFLFDAQNNKSDIDLVCYGAKGYENAAKLFHDSSLILPYTGLKANDIYSRRMTHMAVIDFDALVRQESRKLQGLINGIHINCQPLRADHDPFMNMELTDLGEIKCIAYITCHDQGIYAPAYYEIKVDHIVSGLFENTTSFRRQIKALLSFNGTYAQAFRQGDKVFVEGRLVQITKDHQWYYGIELSAWNTNEVMGATLLA